MSWYNDDQALARQRRELEEKRAALNEIAERMKVARQGMLDEVKAIVQLAKDNDLGYMTGIPDWAEVDMIEVDDYTFQTLVEKIFDRWSVIDTAEQWASSHHC